MADRAPDIRRDAYAERVGKLLAHGYGFRRIHRRGVRGGVQEALVDPRPRMTLDEAFRRLRDDKLCRRA